MARRAGSARIARRNSMPFMRGIFRSRRMMRRSAGMSGASGSPRSMARASTPSFGDVQGVGDVVLLERAPDVHHVQVVVLDQQNVKRFFRHCFPCQCARCRRTPARPFQRLDPAAAPRRVVGQHAGRVAAAAGDELRVEGPAGRRPGRLVAQVQAPADVVAVVGRGAVGRVAVHEDDAALADGDRARRHVRQQVGPDGRAALRLVFPDSPVSRRRASPPCSRSPRSRPPAAASR